MTEYLVRAIVKKAFSKSIKKIKLTTTTPHGDEFLLYTLHMFFKVLRQRKFLSYRKEEQPINFIEPIRCKVWVKCFAKSSCCL